MLNRFEIVSSSEVLYTNKYDLFFRIAFFLTVPGSLVCRYLQTQAFQNNLETGRIQFVGFGTPSHPGWRKPSQVPSDDDGNGLAPLPTDPCKVAFRDLQQEFFDGKEIPTACSGDRVLISSWPRSPNARCVLHRQHRRKH